MRNGTTRYGRKIRELRTRFDRTMREQAKATGVSVPYISAMELGQRPIPDGHVSAVAEWLSLTPEEARELNELAVAEKRVVKVFPRNEDQASLAEDFAKSLGGLSQDGVNQLKLALQTAKNGRHSDREIRKRAMLANAVFGSRDLLKIAENYIPVVDPDFSMQVVLNGSLGENVQVFSDGDDRQIRRFVCTEWFYAAAGQGTPDARVMLAHEIGHWLLHGGSSKLGLTFHRRLRPFGSKNFHEEIEADFFARELLMPLELVERCNSFQQLARMAMVPLRLAERRWNEVGRILEIEKQEIRLDARQIRKTVQIAPLSAQPEKLQPSAMSHGAANVMPMPGTTPPATTQPKPRARKEKLPPRLPLFDYAEQLEQSQRPKSRQDEWFSEFGWRG